MRQTSRNLRRQPRTMRSSAHSDLPTSFEELINGWSEKDRLIKFGLAEEHFRQAADLKALRAFKAYRQKYFSGKTAARATA